MKSQDTPKEETKHKHRTRGWGSDWFGARLVGDETQNDETDQVRRGIRLAMYISILSSNKNKRNEEQPIANGGLEINRPHAHAHDSRTNHPHKHRASNGTTTLNSRGRRRSPQDRRVMSISIIPSNKKQ